jgi:hypothetical protein
LLLQFLQVQLVQSLLQFLQLRKSSRSSGQPDWQDQLDLLEQQDPKVCLDQRELLVRQDHQGED